MNRCSSNFQSINFVYLKRQQGRCRLLTTAAPSAYGYSIVECPESAFAQYFFQWPLSMLATSRVREEGSKTWHSSETLTPMCKESISRAVTNHNLPRQKQSSRQSPQETLLFHDSGENISLTLSGIYTFHITNYLS